MDVLEAMADENGVLSHCASPLKPYIDDRVNLSFNTRPPSSNRPKPLKRVAWWPPEVRLNVLPSMLHLSLQSPHVSVFFLFMPGIISVQGFIIKFVDPETGAIHLSCIMISKYWNVTFIHIRAVKYLSCWTNWHAFRTGVYPKYTTSLLLVWTSFWTVLGPLTEATVLGDLV